MIKPEKFAHVVLKTSKFPEMIDWYKTVLGAHITFSNEMLAFLTYDEEHHRIAFISIPGLSNDRSATVGVDHFAFTYSNLKDLLANYAELKKSGITPFWCINHGPTTSMYYRDPDGNQLELQVENFDTIAESTEFFHSTAFRENPIGVDFDPESLINRLQQGESEAELKKRPNIGPRTIADGVPLQ